MLFSMAFAESPCVWSVELGVMDHGLTRSRGFASSNSPSSYTTSKVSDTPMSLAGNHSLPNEINCETDARVVWWAASLIQTLCNSLIFVMTIVTPYSLSERVCEPVDSLRLRTGC